MTSRPRRDVACPSCAAVKNTGANIGVKLVCSSCGAAFRCPPPEPATAAAAGAAPPDEGRPAAPAAPNGTGVTVSRAAPVIPQVARPRERGQDHPPAPVVTNPTGKTGPVELHRAAGRRGGLASYARGRMGGR